NEPAIKDAANNPAPTRIFMIPFQHITRSSSYARFD
ncbi:MAG: hypothetical protein ACI9VS_000820, partial [Candidatus Binatia bacterium]